MILENMLVNIANHIYSDREHIIRDFSQGCSQGSRIQKFPEDTLQIYRLKGFNLKQKIVFNDYTRQRPFAGPLLLYQGGKTAFSQGRVS